MSFTFGKHTTRVPLQSFDKSSHKPTNTIHTTQKIPEHPIQPISTSNQYELLDTTVPTPLEVIHAVP